MILSFRPIKVWPEGWDQTRPPLEGSQFTASYSDTLGLLDRELSMLNARHPTLQVDAGDRGVKMDGQLAANARVDYPGVILSFDTPQHGTLTYACNRFASSTNRVRRPDGFGTSAKHFPGWHQNLRAVALGLESLRRLERYGIADRGQQYAGWAELGTGIALGQAMTDSRAWEILKQESGLMPTVADGPNDVQVEMMFKLASKSAHPDNGGDAERFRLVVEARDHLEAP